jgi:purine-binding chemotaxis protein CheW
VVNQEPSIDWEAARRRLHRNETALEKGLAGDTGRVEEIFRQRAAQLARPRAAGTAAGAGPAGVPAVLVFALQAERYAIALEQVREVAAAPQITPIPGSPEKLAGVINLRGQIEPVWEAALLVGLEAPASRGPGYVVLLRREGLPAALRVDQLLGALPLPPAPWQPAAQPSPYSKGVSADGITLIDADALLEQGGMR